MGFPGRRPFVPAEPRRARSPTARQLPRLLQAAQWLLGWRSRNAGMSALRISHVAPRPADATVVRTTQSSRGFRGRPPCTPPARWRSRSPTARRPAGLPRAAPANVGCRRFGSRMSLDGDRLHLDVDFIEDALRQDRAFARGKGLRSDQRPLRRRHRPVAKRRSGLSADGCEFPSCAVAQLPSLNSSSPA